MGKSRCPDCLAENPLGSNLCVRCGARLFLPGFHLSRFLVSPWGASKGAAAAGAVSPPLSPPESTVLSDSPAAVSFKTPIQESEAVPPDSPWVTPRLYDEETETLTPDAFKLFGGALVDEAREQNLPGSRACRRPPSFAPERRHCGASPEA